VFPPPTVAIFLEPNNYSTLFMHMLLLLNVWLLRKQYL